MNRVSISIDVPDIDEGLRFCTSAFGFSKASHPVPGVVVLNAGAAEICLLEKRAGSKPSTHTDDIRRYERHWTPVHLDVHVENLRSALATALAAGARQEQIFESSEHGSAAFCSDPFGHGFCLIEKAR
jgi:predicted enzyme related to lactoylglutathione lyase